MQVLMKVIPPRSNLDLRQVEQHFCLSTVIIQGFMTHENTDDCSTTIFRTAWNAY